MKIETANTYTLPTIKITLETWVKMKMLVDSFETEIGWLSSVFYDAEADTYTVDGVFVPEQTVHSAETDMKQEDIVRLQQQLIEKGLDNYADNMLCWGHSHVNMPVSPSKTDEETFEESYSTNPDIYIMIIMNKSGAITFDVYLDGFIYRGYPFEIDYGIGKKMLDDFIEEAKGKAKRPIYKSKHPSPQKYPMGGVGLGKPQSPASGGAKSSPEFGDWFGMEDEWLNTGATKNAAELPTLEELWANGYFAIEGAPKTLEELSNLEEAEFYMWCSDYDLEYSDENVELWYTLAEHNISEYL